MVENFDINTNQLSLESFNPDDEQDANLHLRTAMKKVPSPKNTKATVVLSESNEVSQAIVDENVVVETLGPKKPEGIELKNFTVTRITEIESLVATHLRGIYSRLNKVDSRITDEGKQKVRFMQA